MFYTPWEERRKAFRIKSRLPLHYELIPACAGRYQAKYGDCLSQDISEGGLRLILEEFIPRDTKMSLKINLTANNVLEVNGQVRWARLVPRSYRYEAGLEFTDVARDARRSLSGYVARNR